MTWRITGKPLKNNGRNRIIGRKKKNNVRTPTRKGTRLGMGVCSCAISVSATHSGCTS